MKQSRKQYNCLRLGWEINEEYGLDGFFGIIIEGKQRIGKSSLASQSIAEAYGEYGYDPPESKSQDFEAVKPWMVFRPIEFLNVVLNVTEKQKVIFWDDSGYWLFALDWYEPFVKAVSRYIQLIGRQFACLIMTTPNQELISSKILASLPSMYICNVVKLSSDTPSYRPRLAKVYEKWSYPDGKRGGVRKRWEDRFNAMLPDNFFNWYKPISDAYTKTAIDIMRTEVKRLSKRLDKKEESDFMETVHKNVGDEERLKELNQVLDNMESENKEEGIKNPSANGVPSLI